MLCKPLTHDSCCSEQASFRLTQRNQPNDFIAGAKRWRYLPFFLDLPGGIVAYLFSVRSSALLALLRSLVPSVWAQLKNRQTTNTGQTSQSQCYMQFRLHSYIWVCVLLTFRVKKIQKRKGICSFVQNISE